MILGTLGGNRQSLRPLLLSASTMFAMLRFTIAVAYAQSHRLPGFQNPNESRGPTGALVATRRYV